MHDFLPKVGGGRLLGTMYIVHSLFFFVHRLFTPASTPNGMDLCLHDWFYSRLKGRRASSLGSKVGSYTYA